MTFQKGNKLWEKGIEVKKQNQAKIDAFLMAIADSGIEKYGSMMGKLADGVELPKPNKEYMDRLEGWAEFVRPKLSRAEVTGKDGKDLPQPILLNALPSKEKKENS